VYASTGHTDVTKRGHSWFGVNRWKHQSSKGVNCDILTQDIIGLVEYSYHQDIPSIPEVQLKSTLALSVLISEQFFRWVTDW
jgi:hypothetical protein